MTAMTEDTVSPVAPQASPARKRRHGGGWPKGKPRRAAPPSPELVKAIADRAARPIKPIARMKAKPNWDDETEFMVADEGTDRLRIPKEIVEALAADGIALQWITHSLRGLEMPLELGKYVRGGWTPVHQSDFDGILDGMFMPKGMDEVVRVDDAMLVARPMSINVKAKQRERQLAREPLRVKEAEVGQGLPLTGGDHPSARSQNRISRTSERIEIPD